MPPSSDNNASAPVSAATKLRQRLGETDDLILLPGVYDGFSARIALEVGFDGLYMVRFPSSLRPSLASQAWGYLLRFFHLLTFDGLTQKQTTCAPTPTSTPPSPWSPTPTRATAAPTWSRAPSRRSAAATSRASRSSTSRPLSRASAPRRSPAEEACEACEALRPTPVLLNMVEHGATPSWTAAEAKALGYRVMIVPFAAIAPAYEAIRESLVKLKETGKVGTKPDFSPRKLFSIVGLQEAMDFDAAAGGSAYGKL
ncbi:hypothetical protein LX32DRAFT_710374 [Colletotrichum zoysiae]|uniref:Carboxyvinyl-carboxyphosphonate phosphorylmutase n=1 Tax=Colletotrichum zoysiae TaxID=1216348 RepID=A0AAD9HQ50_9PEZI|nr:hypothetical protein LX32DRAFT_710374 [Colletotrichum zoysiae]